MFDSYVLGKKALKQIHNHTFKNRSEIAKSVLCHCIYCKEASPSSHVDEWADEGETALCPKCGVDSMVGDASGYEMTVPLLSALQDFWFEQDFLGKDFDYSILEPFSSPE
jgi:hypothetical protein